MAGALRRFLFQMFHFAVILIALASFVNTQYVLLNTSQGALKGTIEKSRAGRQFFAFYGIPYAEPPVGELRFEDPVAPKPWTGVRDCRTSPSACLWYKFGKLHGQEDCLYLNLYTPKFVSDTPLPVMVFIHGGRFMYKSATPRQYGPHYFMDKDVILVTFNYRLGVFGFLSTEDEHLPGNYGLKDFAAVLRWVQEHIHSFAGDNKRVTIMGASSGGCMVSYALMSPLTEGLYHRAISQSGFPAMGILPRGVARKRAWDIAKAFGCAFGGSKDLRSCLKEIPAVELITALPPFIMGQTEDNSITVPNNETMEVYLLFGAVIEDEKRPGAFLVDTPEVLLPRKTDMPWIIGINSAEGGMVALLFFYDDELRNRVLAENYQLYFPLLLRLASDFKEALKLQTVAERLKERFFGDTDIAKNPIGIAKMINLDFLLALKECLHLYGGPKYVYYYDHKGVGSLSQTYVSHPPEVNFGVIHGEELLCFFNASDVLPPVTNGVDLVVSEQMIDLWTNFATFGDPNGMGKKIWTLWNSSRMEYLHVKNGELKMREELLRDEFKFLDELLSLVAEIEDAK